MLHGNRIGSTEQAVFGIALVLLIAGDAVAGWNGEAVHAAVVSAVLGAATLAGVAAAGNALVPKDPAASVIAVIVIGLSPAFRHAVAFDPLSIAAAMGTVWAFAWSCRRVSPRSAGLALAAGVVTTCFAPWLGLPITIAAVVKLTRGTIERPVTHMALGAVGLVALIIVITAARGRLPELRDRSAELIAVLGLGSTVVVIGIGLLGLGFGAATGLPGASWLATLVSVAAIHAGVAGDDAAVVVIVGVAIAVIPAAIVRAALAPDTAGEIHHRRHYVALAGGVPLIAAALLTGPAFSPQTSGPTLPPPAQDVGHPAHR